ncbi:UDP-N-acetylglucosamine--N-acetylmuramyl-(pentapeptide) pyrophosphoryl-undecaprenol N-acetylglucosamine transferase [Candidatus Sumerlaeota bacterium]|nr:UDP-N-acetylglucosamine--N-acetylmuramyl-(pentapeptide) pyrophosphoryl-undecaprenol N-acetylglucosamine transferase [Candidatus Sumerlaeota bacterium]
MRRALLAAGGTGGHIWPAVAVAQALESLDPPWRCRFVSGDRPVETEVYRAAGIGPAVFPVPPPSGGRWRTWLAMGPALLRARRLIRRERPHVILATGGYISAPVALAGWMARVPTVLLEPNSIPGRVTRRLAPKVSAVAVSDPAAGERLRAKRIEVTGNPLTWSRSDLDRETARRNLGVPENSVCLLVVGGSQGARTLNGLVMDLLKRWAADPPSPPVHLIWITGSGNLDGVREQVSTLDPRPSNLALFGHLWPMTEALAAADLVISRAGAGAVADLAEAGLPSILLPLPIALDDHQRANARRLVEAEAAVIFDERSQSGEEFASLVTALIGDRPRRASMAEAARSVAQPDAARRVAELMVELGKS